MGYSYCPGALPAGPVPNGLNDCCSDSSDCYASQNLIGTMGGTLCCIRGVPPSIPCDSPPTPGQYTCCNGKCWGDTGGACTDPPGCVPEPPGCCSRPPCVPGTECPTTNVCRCNATPTGGSKCCPAGFDSCTGTVGGNFIVECCASYYDGDFGSPSDVEYCQHKADGTPVCCRDHGVMCGDACCPRNRDCAGNAAVGTCCRAAEFACGTRCCDDVTEYCRDAATNKCCLNTEMACGGTFCCEAGKTCVDPALNLCCAANEDHCGTRCCPDGQFCGSFADSQCCPDGTTGCGTACCAAGQFCAAAGRCCPNGTQLCADGTCAASCYP